MYSWSKVSAHAPTITKCYPNWCLVNRLHNISKRHWSWPTEVTSVRGLLPYNYCSVSRIAPWCGREGCSRVTMNTSPTGWRRAGRSEPTPFLSPLIFDFLFRLFALIFYRFLYVSLSPASSQFNLQFGRKWTRMSVGRKTPTNKHKQNARYIQIGLCQLQITCW